VARGGARPGAGRKTGALTKRTREVAERAVATGKTPLEIMLANMTHFQQVALDAEAMLEGLTAEEFAGQVAQDATPEDQFKYLLAQVKKTVGLRQAAQDAARDAAPYVHPKLSSVEVDARVAGSVTVQYVTKPGPAPTPSDEDYETGE